MTAPTPRTDEAKKIVERENTSKVPERLKTDWEQAFKELGYHMADLETDLAAHRDALREAYYALKPFATESEKIHSGFDLDKYAHWSAFVSDFRKAQAALSLIQPLVNQKGEEK